MILGFDPGKDKCGIAVMTKDWQRTTYDRPSPCASDPGSDREPDIIFAEVVAAKEALATVLFLIQHHPIATMVIGDQTMAKHWKSQFEQAFETSWNNSLLNQKAPLGSAHNAPITIILVDERYSTLEARDRYWQLHPPAGITRFIPPSLRKIPRPIDDVVAIILIERYWQIIEKRAISKSGSSTS